MVRPPSLVIRNSTGRPPPYVSTSSRPTGASVKNAATTPCPGVGAVLTTERSPVAVSTMGPRNMGLPRARFSQSAPAYPASGAFPWRGLDEHATEPSGRMTSTWPRPRPLKPKLSVHEGCSAAWSMFGVAARLATVVLSAVTPVARFLAAVLAAKAASWWAVCRASRSACTNT